MLKDSNMHSPKKIAEWMVSQFPENGWLYQEIVVRNIKKEFGEDYIYLNQNQNDAINKDILKEFKNITEGKVQWSRGDKAWRIIRAGEPTSSRTY
jgi:hypothetical protein